MRWDDLFADLDRRYLELRDDAEDAEQADRIRVEYGAVGIEERLTGALGGQLKVLLPGGRSAAGRLDRVGRDWLLLADTPTTQMLVPLAAVAAVEGLAIGTGPSLSDVAARFDLRKVLRSVARDRSPVAVHTSHDRDLVGTIDRVGRDFVELATHASGELRRAGSVRSVLLVPVSGLVSVRASPWG